MTDLIPLEHPGEIVLHEFMKPLDISAYRLAKDISVPITRITNITQGKRAITADTALRLARYFRMSDNFFLNLQKDYDLRMARREMEADIAAIQPFPRPDLPDAHPTQ